MRAATPCASPGSCACGRISRRKRQTRLNARGKSIPNRHLPNSGQMEHPMELRYLEKYHVLRQNTSGGGAPRCLWEFGSHLLYTHSLVIYARWLEPNVAFLRRILNPGTARAMRSIERSNAWRGQPQHGTAAAVEGDLPWCEEILVARCA